MAGSAYGVKDFYGIAKIGVNFLNDAAFLFQRLCGLADKAGDFAITACHSQIGRKRDTQGFLRRLSGAQVTGLGRCDPGWLD